MYEEPFNLPKFVFKGFGIAFYFLVSGFTSPFFSAIAREISWPQRDNIHSRWGHETMRTKALFILSRDTYCADVKTLVD